MFRFFKSTFLNDKNPPSFESLSFREQIKFLQYKEENLPSIFINEITDSTFDEPFVFDTTTKAKVMDRSEVEKLDLIKFDILNNCYNHPYRGFPIILFQSERHKSQWLDKKNKLKARLNKIETQIENFDFDPTKTSLNMLQEEIEMTATKLKKARNRGNFAQIKEYNTKMTTVLAKYFSYSIKTIEVNLEREKHSSYLKKVMDEFIRHYKKVYDLKAELKRENDYLKKQLDELIQEDKEARQYDLDHKDLDDNAVQVMIQTQSNQHESRVLLPIKISLHAALKTFLESTKEFFENEKEKIADLMLEFEQLNKELSATKSNQIILLSLFHKGILTSKQIINTSCLDRYILERNNYGC